MSNPERRQPPPVFSGSLAQPVKNYWALGGIGTGDVPIPTTFGGIGTGEVPIPVAFGGIGTGEVPIPANACRSPVLVRTISTANRNVNT
jgi:hypothetical protein